MTKRMVSFFNLNTRTTFEQKEWGDIEVNGMILGVKAGFIIEGLYMLSDVREKMEVP